jgi:hypothetical protein
MKAVRVKHVRVEIGVRLKSAIELGDDLQSRARCDDDGMLFIAKRLEGQLSTRRRLLICCNVESRLTV